MGLGKHIMKRLGEDTERRYGVPFHIFLLNGGHLIRTETEIRDSVPGWLEAERVRIKCSRIRVGSIP